MSIKLLIVGHGRSGKDEAGNYLEYIGKLKFAGTTSKYLTPYVASFMGVSDELAYEERHRYRDIWYGVGKRLRENDPGILLRQSLRCGDIVFVNFIILINRL